MKKKIIILTLVTVIVLGFSTTAFAVGEKINHSGISTKGYFTTETVPQMNDTTLVCEAAGGSPNYTSFTAKAWRNDKRNTEFGHISINTVNFKKGEKLHMLKSGAKRDVCIRIENAGDSKNVSSRTVGRWVLRA